MTIPAHDDLQGWMSDAEGEVLQRLARGRRVLEVGSWKGRSAITMLLGGAEFVMCVDHFNGDAFTGNVCPFETFKQFSQNVAKYGVGSKLVAVIGDYSEVLTSLDLNAFDLFYYDADHTFEATDRFLQTVQRQALGHSVWAVHDYDKSQSQYVGAVKAVDSAVQRTGRSLRVVDRLAILEPSR